MKASAVSTDDRMAQLQQRCEQQRQQLNQHFTAIESQLQTANMMMATLRGAVKSPTLWLSVLTGFWAIKKSVQRTGMWSTGLLSLISRGWMMWSIVRRIIKLFKTPDAD